MSPYTRRNCSRSPCVLPQSAVCVQDKVKFGHVFPAGVTKSWYVILVLGISPGASVAFGTTLREPEGAGPTTPPMSSSPLPSPPGPVGQPTLRDARAPRIKGSGSSSGGSGPPWPSPPVPPAGGGSREPLAWEPVARTGLGGGAFTGGGGAIGSGAIKGSSSGSRRIFKSSSSRGKCSGAFPFFSRWY